MNKISLYYQILNSNKIVFGFILFILFCSIYLVNLVFPLIYDDWIYSFVYEENMADSHRISSIYDILYSQYNHYFIWGGRNVVHAILQFLLFIDIRIAKLLNSVVYILFFFVIYKIINEGKKTDISLFLFLNIIVWLTYHSFSYVAFFLTLSTNYLWGTCLVFLFIYPYYLFFVKKASKDSFVKCIFFFLWGIFSGWTNENIVLAMIFFIILLLGYLKYQNIKIPKWTIVGLIGVCIGCVVMLLAPGNKVRLDKLYQIMGLSEFSFFDLFKIRLSNLYRVGAIRLSVFAFIYAVLFFCYLKKNTFSKEKLDNHLFLSLAFFLSGLVAFFVLFPVPLFPDSTWVGIHIFFFIGIGILFVNISFRNLFLKYSKIVVSILLFVAFSCYFAIFYKEAIYFSEEMKKRELLVEKEKGRGNKDVVFLYRLSFPEGFPFYDPISQNELSWQNVGYARYYGLNTVKTK